MTTQFNKDPYVNGVNDFGTLFSDTVYSATLAANTDTSVAVPGTAAMGAPTAYVRNKFLAVFYYSTLAAPVFVALNAAAAAPAGAAFAATTSEMNIAAKVVKTGDVIHFRSTGTPSVFVTFYAIQE